MNVLYFDDNDKISRLTSHPNFNKILPEELYMETNHVFSPFGSDIGKETLIKFSEWYFEGGSDFVLDFFADIFYEKWGVHEDIVWKNSMEDEEEIKAFEKENGGLLHGLCQLVVATAFGQFKIRGTTDDYIKEIVENAVKQQILILNYKQTLSDDDKIHLDYLNRILTDLNKIPLLIIEY
jgi:uncharacterized protein YfeS